MIEMERVKETIKGRSKEGNYIVYWMQSAQRVVHNHALKFAIDLANKRRLPLKVVFTVVENFPNANTRHFKFMLEGLMETQSALIELGCTFEWFLGEPEPIILEYCHKASACVMDDAYLSFERHLKQEIKYKLACEVYEVSTNVVVPVEIAYPKAAYGAYVLRPSLLKRVDRFYKPFKMPNVDLKSTSSNINPINLGLLNELKCPHLDASNLFKGGFSEAIKHLNHFIEHHLIHYGEASNDASLDVTSKLSAYLHFGQISPITIMEAVYQSGLPNEAFFEQLIIRRELAFNYVFYERHYNEEITKWLPEWAYKTLDEHRQDLRDPTYTLELLENAQTYDPFWNAAQRQLVTEGRIHNYMRMYWGKKIIEWSATPEIAFAYMCYLNDKFALDGRDPNGYASIAWCFGKHDRPWGERLIFGKVRYMNQAGLKKKFKLESYLEKYR